MSGTGKERDAPNRNRNAGQRCRHTIDRVIEKYFWSFLYCVISARLRRFCLPMYVRFAAISGLGAGGIHRSAVPDGARCARECSDRVGFLSCGGIVVCPLTIDLGPTI